MLSGKAHHTTTIEVMFKSKSGIEMFFWVSMERTTSKILYPHLPVLYNYVAFRVIGSPGLTWDIQVCLVPSST